MSAVDVAARKFKALRDRKVHARSTYTWGQAFLLSKQKGSFTAAEALAYLSGPSYESLRNTNVLKEWERAKKDKFGHVRYSQYVKSGKLFPNLSASTEYSKHIYSKIDMERFKEHLAPLNWSDSSRRCFEIQLAYLTIKRFKNLDYLGEILVDILNS